MSATVGGSSWRGHQQRDPAVPTGTSVESPWLLTAPAWAQGSPVTDTPPRKRTMDEVSIAEATLGKLAQLNAKAVARVWWNTMVHRARGDSNISEGAVRGLPHKASRLLEQLRRRGAGVLTSTGPWGPVRCDDAVRRGSHKSAHLDRSFVFEEMQDFCAQGYWTVLPYEAVRHWPSLPLSPLGAVPQRDRRPRLIVDYSFSGVNAETVKLTPPEAMQFG